MKNTMRPILLLVTFFFFLSSCIENENAKQKKELLNTAQQLMSEAQHQLNEIEQDSSGGSINDSLSDKDKNKMNDGNQTGDSGTYTDFSLDIPDHGLSIKDIPDGTYILKSVTTTFTKSEEKISGGAEVKIKLNKPPVEQKELHIMPGDYSVQKFSGKESCAEFEGRGFIDWGSLNRDKYDFGPDIILLLPLKIKMSSGSPSYNDKVSYYSEFETWTNGGQEVELVIREAKRSGVDFTKLLNDKYLEKDVYHSEEVKLYSDEVLSLLIVSVGEGTLDFFMLIQHESEERKVNLSYEMQ